MSRNSIQPRDSTGDGFHSFIAPRTKLSFDLNDAHGNSWNRFFLSFSSRGDRISRTTEFFLRLRYIPSLNGKGTRAPATLPPVSHTRRKKKNERTINETANIPRTEIKSNVQRPFPIPFPFFSPPISHTFTPSLLFLSPFPLLSSTTRAHWSNREDSASPYSQITLTAPPQLVKDRTHVVYDTKLPSVVVFFLSFSLSLSLSLFLPHSLSLSLSLSLPPYLSVSRNSTGLEANSQ